MEFSDKSVLEPFVALKGVWDFAKDKQLSGTGLAIAPETWSARLEAGASYRTKSGVTVRASGAIDGIGSETYHAKQGQVFVIVPLQ